MRIKIRFEILEVRDHSENLCIYKNILLNCILWKQCLRVWIGKQSTGEGPLAGSCEHGNAAWQGHLYLLVLTIWPMK
jgi:hypothetical protein